MDDFEKWRVAKQQPVDDFSKWKASRQGPQSIDTGAQQSVYEPGEEAIMRGGEVPPGQETVYAPDTSEPLWKKAGRVLAGMPSSTPGGFAITPAKSAEQVSAKGRAGMELFPMAVEAGMPAMIPPLAAYGALKGATKSIASGEGIGDVATHAGRAAIGESAILSTLGRQAGIEPEHITATGEMGYGPVAQTVEGLVTMPIALKAGSMAARGVAGAIPGKAIEVPRAGEFSTAGDVPGAPATAAQLAREEPMLGVNKPAAQGELEELLAANRAAKKGQSWPPIVEPADVPRPTQTIPATVAEGVDVPVSTTQPQSPTVFYDKDLDAYTAFVFDKQLGNMHGKGSSSEAAVTALEKHLEAARKHGTWRSVEHQSTTTIPAAELPTVPRETQTLPAVEPPAAPTAKVPAVKPRGSGATYVDDPVIRSVINNGKIRPYKGGYEAAESKRIFPFLDKDSVHTADTMAEQVNSELGTKFDAHSLSDYLEGGSKAPKQSIEYLAKKHEAQTAGAKGKYEPFVPDTLEEGTKFTDLKGEERTVHHTETATLLKDGETIKIPYDRPVGEREFYARAGSIKPPAEVPGRLTRTLEAAPEPRPAQTPTQMLDTATLEAADELAAGVTPKQAVKSALRLVGGKEIKPSAVPNVEMMPQTPTQGGNVFDAIKRVFTSPHNQKVIEPVYKFAKPYAQLAELADRQLTALQNSAMTGFASEAEGSAFRKVLTAFDAEGAKITPQELGRRLIGEGVTPERLHPLIQKGMDERRFQDIASNMIGRVKGEKDPLREAAIDALKDPALSPAKKMEIINTMGIDVERGLDLSPFVSPRREGHLFHLFNDWYVEGTFPEAARAGYGKNEILTTFRNPREAMKFAEKEAAANPNVQYRIYPKSALRDQAMLESVEQGGYSRQDALKLAGNMEKRYGMTLEEARQITAPTEHRFLGMLMQRKGTAGFDADIAKAMDYQRKATVRYIQTEAVKQHTSQMFFGKYGFDPFKTAWEDIAKTFKGGGRNAGESAYDAKALYNYIRKINGNITPTEGVINDAITSVFKTFGMEPPSGRPSLYYQTRITKLIAATKLGALNPSSFFVNLGQSALVFAKTDTDAFMKGVADIAHPSRELKLLYRQLNIEKASKFGGLGEAGFYQLKSPEGKLTEVADFLMLPFRYAEVGTRRIAAATALNMAKKEAAANAAKGIKGGSVFQRAKEIADKLITETLFDYSILDSPAYLSNPLTKVLFQFKQFSTKYLEAVAGMNAKEFAKWFGATTLISGAGGIPLSATGAAVAKGLGVDIDAKMKEALYQWAAKGDETESRRKMTVVRSILRGLPASSLGVDLSRRFGVDIANVTGNETALEALASALTGPAVSTVGRVAQEAVSPSPLTSAETRAGRIIGAISPGVKNIYEGGRAIKHEIAGEPQAVRGFKQQLEERPGAANIVKMSTGLKPLSSSERIDVRNIQHMHEQEIKKVKDEVDAALLKGDPNRGAILKNAILTIKKYDPEAKYDISKRLIQRIKEQNIPEAERKMMEVPVTMQPMLKALNRK